MRWIAVPVAAALLLIGGGLYTLWHEGDIADRALTVAAEETKTANTRADRASVRITGLETQVEGTTAQAATNAEAIAALQAQVRSLGATPVASAVATGSSGSTAPTGTPASPSSPVTTTTRPCAIGLLGVCVR